MCGICGAIRFTSRIDPDLLSVQRDAMAHRGPDSFGVWSSPDARVGFAHRRLAIIDLSPAGHQPMTDAVSSNVITFNGEIYNYVALRDELRARGHAFHTSSDTEVILAAYREWGRECVAHLEGMFAFAIYDPTKRVVLFARDRAGEKPLFFHANADGLTFASELKALLADPAIPRRVRRQSLNEYLAYGYVAGAHSMLADVKRLPPGCTMEVRLDTGAIDIRPYWTLPHGRETAADAAVADSVESYTDSLHALLRDAVTRQLVSDVPIGVLLSGGVDSSIIAAVAAEVSQKPVRTFTVRFKGHHQFDEGPYARLVADHLKTDHTELEAAPAEPDLLRQLVRQFDDPIADSSMIPTYLVSREIRQHATVALGGDGGDELFGGYFRYPVQIRQDQLRRSVPAFLRSPIGIVAQQVMPASMPGRAFATGLAADVGAGLALAGRIFRQDERRALSPALRALSDEAMAAPEASRAASVDPDGSVLQRSTSLDFRNYMVDDVLVKVDRASMLTSLEVRAPFLDRRVIEFAFGSLPDALRATTDARKVILRRLGARMLPSALDLSRKQGFSIPVDAWMRGEWQPMLAEAEASSGALVSRDAISSYRAQLQRGEAVGERLFSLLFLSLWEQAYQISDVVD